MWNPFRKRDDVSVAEVIASRSQAMRERDEALQAQAQAEHVAKALAKHLDSLRAAIPVSETCIANLERENAELRAQVRSMRTRLGNQTKKLRRSA